MDSLVMATVRTSGAGNSGSAGERFAARLRDRSAGAERLSAAAGSAFASAWRTMWTSLAAVVVLLVLVGIGVLLWRRVVGIPAEHDLQVLRDYLLLLVEGVVLVGALGLLVIVVGWLFHTEQAIITPFANATSVTTLTAVSDLLVGHLDRISHVQATPIADIPGERLRSDPVTPHAENIDGSLANVGSVNLGPASISIGQLLIALKRLMPIRNRGTTISGSVQQYGKTFQLVATVQRGRLMDTVMATSDQGDDSSPVTGAVPELAYRIHFALAGRRMEAGSWELLREFTEGRAAFQRYLDGGVVEDREEAVRHTWDAYGMDPTYRRVFGLLYGLGTSFFAVGEYPTALHLLHTALEVSPRTPQALVQIARCHYALHEDDQARQVVQQALARPPAHSTARYLSGLLYGTAGQHEEAIQELMRVERRPRSLRSSAWVTIAGLCLQRDDVNGHKRALAHVARCDFDADPYSRACWLSVARDTDGATDALREAFGKRTVPLDYALRDPDLENVRLACGVEGLHALATRRTAPAPALPSPQPPAPPTVVASAAS
jgi:tetratricopeptide (TPR) repeat protein